MFILECAVCSVQCAIRCEVWCVKLCTHVLVGNLLREVCNVECSGQCSGGSVQYEVCSEQCKIQFSINTFQFFSFESTLFIVQCEGWSVNWVVYRALSGLQNVQSIGIWVVAFYKSKCPPVCPSVCLSVCSLLRYRLKVLLPPLPKVGCPIFLEIWNSWGQIMERSGLRFEHFCLEVVKNRHTKKLFFFWMILPYKTRWKPRFPMD